MQELYQRHAILSWMEANLVKLHELLSDTEDLRLGHTAITGSLESYLDTLEENMFFCDELQVQLAEDSAGGDCAVSSYYKMLESKLLFYAKEFRYVQRSASDVSVLTSLVDR
jgi:hypothetical protein